MSLTNLFLLDFLSIVFEEIYSLVDTEAFEFEKRTYTRKSFNDFARRLNRNTELIKIEGKTHHSIKALTLAGFQPTAAVPKEQWTKRYYLVVEADFRRSGVRVIKRSTVSLLITLFPLESDTGAALDPFCPQVISSIVDDFILAPVISLSQDTIEEKLREKHPNALRTVTLSVALQ